MVNAWEIEDKLRALGARPKKRTTRFDNARTAAYACAAVAALIATYLVDTRLFPVISDSHAIILPTSNPSETVVRFAIQKNRNCKIEAIEFALHGDLVEPIPFKIVDGGLRSRPVGRQVTDEFILAVDQETFIRRGEVLVTHRCHPFWRHVSDMF